MPSSRVSIPTCWPPAHVRILTAICVNMWAVSWAYGLPATLSVQLQNHLDLSGPQYAFLVSGMYTAYSLPNIILPFCSGFMVSWYGERRVLLLVLACVVVGQGFFAFAVDGKQVWGIVLGRFVFGLGGEILGVISNDVITRWFTQDYLSLALAMTQFADRFGQVTTSLVTPRLVADSGVVSTTWMLSFVTMVVTTGCSLYLIPSLVAPKKSNSKLNPLAALRRLPPIFWQLMVICMLMNGVVTTFQNSAQRYLAANFFEADENEAGSALSVTYVLSGILVPPIGYMLELPWCTTPRALFAANILLVCAHTLMLLAVFGAVLPLIILGTAYAIYGATFWSGLAKCILRRDEEPTELANSTALLIPPDAFPEHPDDEDEDDDLSDAEDLRASVAAIDAEGKPVRKHDELVAVAFGTAISLLNLSIAVVPILVASVESYAGYKGIDVVYVTMASLAALACVGLARTWRYS